MRGFLTLLVLLCVTVVDSAGQIVVRDRFDRELNSRALTLLDWEGQIANPAVEFKVELPEDWLPATVEIAGSNSRLHFAERRLPRTEPVRSTSGGPTLTLKLQAGVESDPVVMAIWPDRDTQDEALANAASLIACLEGAMILARSLESPLLFDRISGSLP